MQRDGGARKKASMRTARLLAWYAVGLVYLVLLYYQHGMILSYREETRSASTSMLLSIFASSNIATHSTPTLQEEDESTGSTSFEEDSAVVAWRSYRYRLPRRDTTSNFAQPSIATTGAAASSAVATATDERGSVDLVIGIISQPQNFARRQAIRETWAQGEDVYFLIGGKQFSDVESEFNTFRDILWVNMTENYDDLVVKVGVFFAAAHKYFPHTYTLKTDDDVYMQMPRMRSEILELERNSTLGSSAHFIGGHCFTPTLQNRKGDETKGITLREFERKVLPPYHYGVGYIVSSWFNECLVNAMADKSHMRNEDVFIGVLAERCLVPCTKVWDWSNDWFREGIPNPVNRTIATHLSLTGYNQSEIVQHIRGLHVCNQNATKCTVLSGMKAGSKEELQRQARIAKKKETKTNANETKPKRKKRRTKEPLTEEEIERRANETKRVEEVLATMPVFCEWDVATQQLEGYIQLVPNSAPTCQKDPTRCRRKIEVDCSLYINNTLVTNTTETVELTQRLPLCNGNGKECEVSNGIDYTAGSNVAPNATLGTRMVMKTSQNDRGEALSSNSTRQSAKGTVQLTSSTAEG